MNIYAVTIIPMKTTAAQGKYIYLFISILFQGEKQGVSKEMYQSIETL